MLLSLLVQIFCVVADRKRAELCNRKKNPLWRRVGGGFGDAGSGRQILYISMWMHESQSGGCLNNIIQKMVTSDCSKMQDSAGSPFLPLSFPIALASFCGGEFDQSGTFEKPSVCQGCTKVPGTRQLKTEIGPCLQFKSHKSGVSVGPCFLCTVRDPDELINKVTWPGLSL